MNVKSRPRGFFIKIAFWYKIENGMNSKKNHAKDPLPPGRSVKLMNLILVRDIVRWLRAARNAIEGILLAGRRERHLKFHLVSAFCILLVCFILGLNKMEFIAVVLITLLVIITEMINTAVESAVDLHSRNDNPRSKLAKDVAAGAVLVAAAGALVVGYLVLTPYILDIFSQGLRVARHRPENIALLSLIVVILLVILLKTFFLKEENIRVGFPSGHTAVAFSVFVSACHLFDNRYLLLMLLFLTLVISGYRLILRPRRVRDVLGGMILGGGGTWLLFVIFQ